MELKPEDLLKVKNVGDKPAHIKTGINSEGWLEPGEETLMTFDLYVGSFGHPFVRNTDVHKARDAQVQRAKGWHWRDRSEPWENYKPAIEVETLIDGEQIVPLFDDESGKGVTPTDMSKDTAEMMQKQIAGLEAQLKKMRAEQRKHVPEADMPADEPKKVPTGNR